MARSPEELIDELDELVLGAVGPRVSSARVPSRSVARALRLRASARKRAEGYAARANEQRAKLQATIDRMRFRLTGSDRN